MARASLKLKSASCQIAYWEGGRLRISNYLTRRTFSTNPATLDLIRFFFTPRTIQDALVEFRAYSRESVARAQQNGSGMSWSGRHGNPGFRKAGFTS